MCKNSYEQVSAKTKKTMIFCSRIGKEGTLEQLCISQRYCQNKDRYIEIDQKRDCKYYMDDECK